MTNFFVSVIIPLFNREHFITRAVESCATLPQTGEVIIVDDGSIDQSFDVAKKLETKYPKVKVIQHPDKKNHGRSAARNLGIMMAKYEYISFLDSDDWYLPNRFENEEIIFAKNADVEGVYGITSSEFENQQAQESFFKKFESDISKVDDDILPDDLYKTYLFSHKGQYTTDAIVLKKSVFKKAGLFPDDMSFCEDVHLWCRIAAKCKLVSNKKNQPIATRFVHFENTILNSDKIYHKSFLQLYETLLKWAIKQKEFSYDKKNDFFIGYKKMYPEKSEFKVLLKFILSNPISIFNKYTWHKLIQIMR